MKSSSLLLALMAGLVLSAPGAYAGDGQIDIAYLPYTISEPGSYIVVKDLTL